MPKGILELRSNSTQLLTKSAEQIDLMFSEAFELGVSDERERIYTILLRKRQSLNASRGGRYCDKPYLQETNQKIAFIDWILKDLLKCEVNAVYAVEDDEPTTLAEELANDTSFEREMEMEAK